MLNSIPDVSHYVNHVSDYVANVDFLLILKIISYITLGIIITLYVCRIVGKISAKHISAHHSQLLRRITFYIGLVFSFVFPLKASGIDVTALLSAAGVFAGIITAAVAFASQTSISNFLSGVFLIAEKPFEIGDLVDINNTIGEILSIDLLSVKIRTKDNTFVRIPNEVLLKSQFKNLTRFPIRRCDVKLKIAFTEDLQKVKRILLDVAKNNALCLVSPPPEFNFLEFGDAAIILQFSVWCKKASFTNLQTNIQIEIQAAFCKQEIKFPTTTPILAITSA